MDAPNPIRRRDNRLRGYDYTQEGAYFVTICMYNRISLFGQINDGEMRLTPAGWKIESDWCEIPKRFAGVSLDEWVVMPNHFHGIVLLSPEVASSATPLPPPGLGRLVGAFKSITTHAYVRGVRDEGWPPFNSRLWQRDYYDHIIRNEPSLNRIRAYIRDNPIRWLDDPENV